MRQDFGAHFSEHPLRREIIATAVINYAVNHGGIALLHRLMTATKAELSEAALAYLKADRESNAASLRLRALEAGRAASDEHETLLKIENSLESAACDLLAGKAAP
jgi:NAD-specific glutamate dehydrogenase